MVEKNIKKSKALLGTRIWRVSIVLLIVTGSLFVATASAWAAKVNSNTTAVTLTEGGSQTITVTLDEPIICSDPQDVCDVEIQIGSSDPTRVSTNIATLNWPANQWFQSRQFTISAIADGIHNASNTVVLNYSPIASNSEYYSNFDPASITVTLNDLDPAPATTTTTPAANPTANFVSGVTGTTQKSASPGSSVTISGSNFKPNSQVEATLYSTPKSLGIFTTDSNGFFTSKVKIPANTSLGAHSIVLSGQNSTGSSAGATLGLNVVALANTGSSNTQELSIVGISVLLLGCALVFFRNSGTRLKL